MSAQIQGRRGIDATSQWGIAYVHKGEELIDRGHLYFRDKLPPMDTTYAFHVDINARCLLIRLFSADSSFTQVCRKHSTHVSQTCEFLPLEMMPQLGTNLVTASDHYIFHLAKESSAILELFFYPQILSSM